MFGIVEQILIGEDKIRRILEEKDDKNWNQDSKIEKEGSELGIRFLMYQNMRRIYMFFQDFVCKIKGKR